MKSIKFIAKKFIKSESYHCMMNSFVDDNEGMNFEEYIQENWKYWASDSGMNFDMENEEIVALEKEIIKLSAGKAAIYID